MDDLKNYRAPRRGPWPWILAAAFAVAWSCIVGPIDFAEVLRIEAENKVLRSELARAQRPEAQLAPIRCRDPKRLQHHANQPDGGKWDVHCRDGLLRL